MKPQTMGWLIGYFVVLYPLMYAFNGSLIFGLLNGIIGLIGAIGMEAMTR